MEDKDTPQQEVTSKPVKSNKNLIILLIILVTLATGAAVYFAYQDKQLRKIFSFRSLSPRNLIIHPFLSNVDYRLHRILKGKTPKWNIDNQKECEQAGGEWGQLGWSERCQFYSSDADKKCFSGFQCEFGECLAPFETKRKCGFGKCAGELINFGQANIHFGVIGGIIIIE